MSRAAGLPRLSWFAGLTWFAGGSTGAGCAAHPALARVDRRGPLPRPMPAISRMRDDATRTR